MVNRMNKIVLIIAMSIVVPTVANASSTVSFMQANKLYSLCESGSEIDRGVCDGYIMAVNDTMYSGHLDQLFQACIPQGVSPIQARLVVVKYMKTVPEKLHFVADGVVVEALAKTFPCGEK